VAIDPVTRLDLGLGFPDKHDPWGYSHIELWDPAASSQRMDPSPVSPQGESPP
jgi:hypothetical protein